MEANFDIPKNSIFFQFLNFSIFIWFSYSLWKRPKRVWKFSIVFLKIAWPTLDIPKYLKFQFLNFSFSYGYHIAFGSGKSVRKFSIGFQKFFKKPSIICRSKTCFSTTGFTFSSTAQAVETAQVEQVSTSKSTSKEVNKAKRSAK